MREIEKKHRNKGRINGQPNRRNIRRTRKLEEIKDKILRNRILEETNINEINIEVLNEREILEEVDENYL